MTDQSTLEEFVCGTCGVAVVRSANNRVLHVDSIPEGVAEHDAFPWVTRREYLEKKSGADAGSPGERSAVALERIATVLEALFGEFIVAQVRAGYRPPPPGMDTPADGAVRSGPNPNRD